MDRILVTGGAGFLDSHLCNSLLELAEKIIKLARSKSKIAPESLPPGDPQQRCPDTSLAKEKLGGEPKKNLEEGLSATIEYFHKALNLNRKSSR